MTSSVCPNTYKATGDIDRMFHVLTISSIVGRAEENQESETSSDLGKIRNVLRICV